MIQATLIPGTQKDDLLTYLLRHGKITGAGAMYELGICELSSRIGELEADGWVIPRERIEGTARNGRRYRVMEYRKPYRINQQHKSGE